MAKSTPRKKQTPKPTRGWRHRVFGKNFWIALAIIVVLIIGGNIFVHQRAVRREERVIVLAHQKMSTFHSHLTAQLGSSLTNFKEHDDCYMANNTDFSDGNRWCEVMAEGTAKEVASTDTDATPALKTANKIFAAAQIAMVVQDESPYTHAPKEISGRSDSVKGDARWLPFGDNAPCSLAVDKPVFSAVTIPVGSNEIYFSLSCTQAATRQYFPQQ